MLLDHGAAIRRIHEELTLLRELLTGRLLPPRASLPASSMASLPTLSTEPFAVETAEKMLTRQVSAVVRLQAAARGLLVRRWVGRLLDLQLIQPRTPSQFLQDVRRHAKAATTAAQHQATLRLQAAACGFLARRRLQKAHKQMRDREAALAAVAFAFDAAGCDLDSLDGYQQLCRSAAVSKGAHGVFPANDVLQLCGDGGRGGVFLLVTSGTHYLVPQLSVSDHREDVSVGLRRDCFQVAVPLRPSRSDGLHGIQWSYTCNFVMRMVPTVRESHNKKSESISD
jgi:hypothetical protein